jgi:hypothetical protein
MRLYPARSSKRGILTIPMHWLALAALAFASTSPAHALQPDAKVTMKVAPGSSVMVGSVTTLTATVSHYGTPVTTGSVMFCDAAIGCAGPGVLGTAPLTKGGKATLKLVLGAGDYALQAHFNGLGGAWACDSSQRALSVSGNSSYKSTTTIGQNGRIYRTLTATVTTLGRLAPSGTVSFVDTSNGNLVLATAPLDPATLSHSLIPSTGPSLAVGARAYSAVTGDFNGNGVPDLAIAGSNGVSIFLGKGDGTFETPKTSATGVAPRAIAVGDLNGDNVQDLAVANSGSNTVSVLLGNGDGTFRTPVSYGTGRAPSSVQIADVNWDGIQDLVVANAADDDVSVFLGNGDGTFQSPTSYRTGRGPRKVVLGDFNGDGYLDIATANAADNNVTVLLGNGDGTFGTGQTFAAGSDPESIETGDFNGDGIADLLVANRMNNSFSVLLGNGDGTFQPRVSYSTGAGPQQIVLGDFNGDHVLDVAVANANDGTVSLLYGKGDGTFKSQVVYPVGSSPMAITAADFNGDGLLDLVIPNFKLAGATTASVLLGRQRETATAHNVTVRGVGRHNVLASYTGDSKSAASQSGVIALGVPTKPCSHDDERCEGR